MTDSLSIDWGTVQRIPPTGGYLRQLARNLLDHQSGIMQELNATFEDYAYLIGRGPSCGVPPQAISFARQRLALAAQEGRVEAQQWLDAAERYLAQHRMRESN
jgi:CubicO group peptidase (beta-lactamase class C family)